MGEADQEAGICSSALSTSTGGANVQGWGEEAANQGQAPAPRHPSSEDPYQSQGVGAQKSGGGDGDSRQRDECACRQKQKGDHGVFVWNLSGGARMPSAKKEVDEPQETGCDLLISQKFGLRVYYYYFF